jgi:hypothetical protein
MNEGLEAVVRSGDSIVTEISMLERNFPERIVPERTVLEKTTLEKAFIIGAPDGDPSMGQTALKG